MKNAKQEMVAVYIRNDKDCLQFDALSKYAEENNLFIRELYAEWGQSGLLVGESFKDLMSIKRKKFKKILVYGFDRISRKQDLVIECIETLRKSKVEIISILSELV